MESPSIRLRLAVLCSCFLLLITYRVPLCSGLTVWFDDFNDGNYNGWTVESGNFSAANNQLEVTGSGPNIIEHPSTVAYGTWSFDMDCGNGFGLTIYLLADEIFPRNYSSELPISNGYQIQIYNQTATLIWCNYTCVDMRIGKYTDGIFDKIGGGVISRPTGWTHFDISRDISGNFSMQINGIGGHLVNDNTHKTSTCFGFASSSGPVYDNIIVNDAFTFSSFSQALLSVFIILVIIQVLIIIVIFRRRSS